MLRAGVRVWGIRGGIASLVSWGCLAAALFFHPAALAQELRLEPLIQEALERSPEILAARARALAAHHKAPQARSLPDPMFMTGYQNEGWKKYTYGEMPDAQWMFSASQMIPFPGKLELKGRMAEREAEALEANVEVLSLQVVSRVKELFHELFLAHKTLEILSRTLSLFQRVEEAALARYSSGKGEQQEVLMAQTERYMLLEREEMQKQRVRSLEAMLNAALGRPTDAPLGRPQEPQLTPLSLSADELVRMAQERSPQIKARERMIQAAETRVSMAKKEFFPDLTLAGNYFSRGGGQLEDMWSLTATINVPIFFKTKQEEGVKEAGASLAEARHELAATRLMLASNIRDNLSMLKAAENLMALYRGAIIPKNYQDFELALSGYITGRIEAITVISRLKAFLDTELLYWSQFAQREKALARIEALVGGGGESQ
jgi:cobalt-zinc-cadmium efflux system outer membrane protein